MCSLFNHRGGTITCTVIGMRRFSADLPQGGLEVPYSLVFKAQPKQIQKLKKLWKRTSDCHEISKQCCYNYE